MEISAPSEAELDSLLKEISPLIERLNQEYNKFLSGAEKKAPAQLRDQLERKIDRVRTIARQVQSAALRFRAQTLTAQFTSYSAMWDKKLRERETK